MNRVLRGRRRDDEGAAAVEFALIAPILLLLTFGMIAFGIIFSQQLTTNAAVRDAARKAVVNGQGDSRTCQGIVDSVRASMSGLLINPNAVQVQVTRTDFPAAAAGSACSSGYVANYSGAAASNKPCVGSFNAVTGTSGSLVVETRYVSTIPVAFPPIPRTITLSSKAVYRCEFTA